MTDGGRGDDILSKLEKYLGQRQEVETRLRERVQAIDSDKASVSQLHATEQRLIDRMDANLEKATKLISDRLDDKVVTARGGILSEVEQKDKATRDSVAGMIAEQLPREVDRYIAEKEAAKEAARQARIDKLKKRAQTWTAIIGFLSAAVMFAYTVFGRDPPPAVTQTQKMSKQAERAASQ